MDQNFKQLINRQVDFVAIAEDFFKKAALSELELDSNILHEYRNCVRAQADVLKEIISQDGAVPITPTLLENLATANLAAKCIINDCTDILHGACKIAIHEKLNRQYNFPISLYYADYYKLTEVIKIFDDIIPQTRGARRLERIPIYVKEFTEERAQVMHAFLSAVPEIENRMRFKQQEIDKEKFDKEKANTQDAIKEANKEKQNWGRLSVQLVSGLFIAIAGVTVGWLLPKTNGQIVQGSAPQIQNTPNVTKATPKVNPKTP